MLKLKKSKSYSETANGSCRRGSTVLVGTPVIMPSTAEASTTDADTVEWETVEFEGGGSN